MASIASGDRKSTSVYLNRCGREKLDFDIMLLGERFEGHKQVGGGLKTFLWMVRAIIMRTAVSNRPGMPRWSFDGGITLPELIWDRTALGVSPGGIKTGQVSLLTRDCRFIAN